MTTLAMPSTARLTLPRWLPLACIFVLAVFLRHVLVANTDVSWDLTAADKFLDGQRLYVDVIEVNPPATVLLYVVPALLGRLSGIPAEFFVDVLVFLAIGLSLWLSGRVLRNAGLVENADGWLMACHQRLWVARYRCAEAGHCQVLSRRCVCLVKLV